MVEKAKNKLTRYALGLLLVLITVLISITVYQDYGVSWDEWIQRDIGLTSYKYIVDGDQTLEKYQFRNMGTGFELPLIFLEKSLGLDDTRDIYFMRHLVTHLFFLFGAFCFYILAFKMFKNQVIAALGFILLVFQPRIYGHSFYNCKDIPFLTAFAIVLLLCYIAFEKKTWISYVLLGMACGYATSIRAIGIMLLFFVVFFILIDIVIHLCNKQSPYSPIRNFIFFIAFFCFMTYIAWPVLWNDPIQNFIEQFSSLAHIKYEGEVIFKGAIYKGYSLPWDYMPVWFSITTPELWLIAGLVGILWIAFLFISNPLGFLKNNPERNYLLYTGCFAAPILAMALFHGVNVDDWRHLYFIYPSFVMLALFVLNKINTGNKKIILYIACTIQVGMIFFFIAGNHPFQQLYFNNLVSHKKDHLRYNYDMDYWGTSYRKGLEYILAHDNNPKIRVHCWVGPIQENRDILTKDYRDRILIVKKDENPDYFITNFRNHPEEYEYSQIFYEINVLSSTIMRVYKLH